MRWACGAQLAATTAPAQGAGALEDAWELRAHGKAGANAACRCQRFDLNKIYAVGRRDGGSLFLTNDSVVSVMEEYKRVNAARPECLDPSASNNDYLMSKGFTMAIWPDGSLQLYFDAPYVEAACLSPIRLNAQVRVI
jgi:hypothetical protein